MRSSTARRWPSKNLIMCTYALLVGMVEAEAEDVDSASRFPNPE